MSPGAALHSGIYLTYVWMVGGMLVGGGLLLSAIQFVARRSIGSIWQTYRGWLVMAPLALAVVFAGCVAFFAGVLLVAIFAFREFARASGVNRDGWLVGVVCGAIVVTTIAPEAFACAIAAICLVPIARNTFRGELPRIALATLGFVLLWMFSHLALLANLSNAYGYVCFVIFATQVNDIAAFTFGRLFGRRRLRSEISPNKTWQGALGAFLVSMTLPWLLRFSFPQSGATQLLVTGLIIGIGAQLGDLTVSLFKRDLGVKDMGAAIAGHGGILDRIDSLIFVAPLFFWLANHYDRLR